MVTGSDDSDTGSVGCVRNRTGSEGAGRWQGDGGLAQGTAEMEERGWRSGHLLLGNTPSWGKAAAHFLPRFGVNWTLQGGSQCGPLMQLGSDGSWGWSHASSAGPKTSSCSRWLFSLSLCSWAGLAGGAGFSLSLHPHPHPMTGLASFSAWRFGVIGTWVSPERAF